LKNLYQQGLITREEAQNRMDRSEDL
jgi:hypothetical protein